MSPWQTESGSPHTRFPRVSGDEPNGETRVINFYAFSPRERG